MRFGMCLTLFNASNDELEGFFGSLRMAIGKVQGATCIVSVSVNDSRISFYRKFLTALVSKCETILVVVNSTHWNLGYGAGQNAAVMALPSDIEHVIICNYDIRFRSDFLVNLSLCISKYKRFGLIAPTIITDGEIFNNKKKSIGLTWPVLKGLSLISSWFDKLRYVPENPLTSSVSVEYASGCCFIISRELFIELKGFDTRFFLHFEDADLCRRLLRRDKIIFDSALVVFHDWRRETYKSFTMFMISVRSMVRYLVNI